MEPVAPARQQQAIDSEIATVDEGVLTLPGAVLALIPPYPTGYGRDRESPPAHTGPLMDLVTMAEAAAEASLQLLFNPQRLARVSQQHAIDPSVPSVKAILDQLLGATVRKDMPAGLAGEVRKRVNLVVVEALLSITHGQAQVPEVVAEVMARLDKLKAHLKRKRREPHANYLWQLIDKAEREPFERRKSVAATPPGAPI